jgi:hypothetical protein
VPFIKEGILIGVLYLENKPYGSCLHSHPRRGAELLASQAGE